MSLQYKSPSAKVIPRGSLPGANIVSKIALPTTGSAPAGSAPTGSAPAGSTPAGSAPTGSAPTGSAPAGSAPAGSAPAGSAPVTGTPGGGDERNSAQTVIAPLLDAFSLLDMDAAERLLVQASNDFSPRDLVTRVFAPTLTEMGERWANGELCPASEHAASSLLRTRLGAMLSAQPVGNAPPVVCTTLAGDQHELGALLVAVLIAMRGRRAIFLGANLPADQIAEAARLSRASSVALSIVGLPVADAQRELARVVKALPSTVLLGVGGRGAARLHRRSKRVDLLTTLPDLDRWLEAQPTVQEHE